MSIINSTDSDYDARVSAIRFMISADYDAEDLSDDRIQEFIDRV